MPELHDMAFSALRHHETQGPCKNTKGHPKEPQIGDVTKVSVVLGQHQHKHDASGLCRRTSGWLTLKRLLMSLLPKRHALKGASQDEPTDEGKGETKDTRILLGKEKGMEKGSGPRARVGWGVTKSLAMDIQGNVQKGEDGERALGMLNKDKQPLEESSLLEEQRQTQAQGQLEEEEEEEEEQRQQHKDSLLDTGLRVCMPEPRGAELRKPRLGPYLIEGRLGNGAFCKVKLGRHTSTGVMVALKMVALSDLRTHKELRRALFIELQLLRHCRHPNIIRLETVLLSRHYCTLVLEYPGGPDVEVAELYQLLAASEDGLGHQETAILMRLLLDAVGYLHGRGIVHRDLKPENILVVRPRNKKGPLQLKLIDFGLATMVCGREGTTPPSGSSELLERGPWFGDFVYFETLLGARWPAASNMARRHSTGHHLETTAALKALVHDNELQLAGDDKPFLLHPNPSANPKAGNGQVLMSQHQTARSLDAAEGMANFDYVLSFGEVDGLRDVICGADSPGSAATTPTGSGTPTGTARAALLRTRCGSEEYAPPEILLGRPYHGDRSDIWSLGVLFYVVYYGALPFSADPMDGAALFKAICCGRIRWPSAPKYGPKEEPLCVQETAFRELVRGMLRVIPEERFTLEQIKEASWFQLVVDPAFSG